MGKDFTIHLRRWTFQSWQCPQILEFSCVNISIFGYIKSAMFLIKDFIFRQMSERNLDGRRDRYGRYGERNRHKSEVVRN